LPEALIRWILAGRTLEERLRRIETALAREGYTLPPLPRGVDLTEAGQVHWLWGEPHTVRYSVVDQGERQVYHYLEREVDHIMLQRFKKGDEWALEHLSVIPHLLKQGQIVEAYPDKVVYFSQRRYFHPDKGIYGPLCVVIRSTSREDWYVDTFFPVY